jgi:hypothetical protein
MFMIPGFKITQVQNFNSLTCVLEVIVFLSLAAVIENMSRHSRLGKRLATTIG